MVPILARRSRARKSPSRWSARIRSLVRRADGNPTIIAGYPWFTDWGRDTMISLPGLLIVQGRLEEARENHRRISRAHLEAGLIPNRFPDSGETPNTTPPTRRCGCFRPCGTGWRPAAIETFLRGYILSRGEGNHRLAPARHASRYRGRSGRSSAERREEPGRNSRGWTQRSATGWSRRAMENRSRSTRCGTARSRWLADWSDGWATRPIIARRRGGFKRVFARSSGIRGAVPL